MKLKKLYYTSLFYVILGLISGIFYREYTKMVGFEGDTLLTAVHTHLLVLGFMFFLIVLILGKSFAIHEAPLFNMWFYVYNLGLLLTVSTMIARGIGQVENLPLNGLSHAAGLGHAVLGTSLVWLLVMLGKRIKE